MFEQVVIMPLTWYKITSDVLRDFFWIPLVSKITHFSVTRSPTLTWWGLWNQKFLSLILLHCWKRLLRHFRVWGPIPHIKIPLNTSLILITLTSFSLGNWSFRPHSPHPAPLPKKKKKRKEKKPQMELLAKIVNAEICQLFSQKPPS